MICPHCQTKIHTYYQFIAVGKRTANGEHATATVQCPACDRITVNLAIGSNVKTQGFIAKIEDGFTTTYNSFQIYPQNTMRPPLPDEIPIEYAADYNEAALILSLSPKASAALSRRCLQNILHNEMKIRKKSLADEITEAINSQRLPSEVADGLDAIRRIGNFAAHPKKSEASGEIIEVEPGEAEWSLDILDAIFDCLFVWPAKMKARRLALDAKLSKS